MQKIGFANEYYTLWNVDKYGKCFYVKNISKERDVAFSKYPGVEFDETLKGVTVIYDTEPKGIDMTTFLFGKYNGEKLVECEDTDYLYWYYRCATYNEQESIIKEELLKRGFVLVDDALFSPKEYENYCSELEEMNNILNDIETGQQLHISRNLNVDGDYWINPYICLHFNNYKQLQYRDTFYALPTIKGVGKRVKNKNIILIDYNIENNSEQATTININDFKIA